MSGYAGVGVRQVYFAPNNTWANRTVTAYVERTNANLSTYNWIGVYSGTQPGYAVTWSTSGTAAGGEFVVTVKGTGATPQLELRCAVGNVQIAGSAVTYLAAGSSGTRQQTVTVPNNPATNPTRAVQIQWRHSGVTNWATIATYNQPPGSHVLSSGRIVSTAEAGAGTWAWAMGISTTYNTQRFMNLVNYPLSASTGCGGYSETGYGVGSWRLPTPGEAKEIIAAIPGYQTGSISLWTSDDANVYDPYWEDRMVALIAYWSYGAPITYSKYKQTSQYRARCVRNP